MVTIMADTKKKRSRRADVSQPQNTICRLSNTVQHLLQERHLYSTVTEGPERNLSQLKLKLLTLALLTGYKMCPGLVFSSTVLGGTE